MRTARKFSFALATVFALAAPGAFAADDGTWSVKKSSGEVWMGSGDVQQASVKTDEVLKPGDTIRTGRNGRVLLVRGEESILIAPNSVIGLPAEKKEGLSTTITQQAGSILLEVEKKNVKHFEVETPYLAAVVKGTQFRVSVTASGATVDVVRGQVEVADFKSGQIAQVMPGQHATAFSHGNAGLSLGGAGSLQPIQNGQPRASSIDRVTVPRNGLSAPTKPGSASLKPGPASIQQHRHTAGPRPGVIRISSSLGDVKLNVHRVTHGLARNSNAAQGVRSASRDGGTVWGSGDSGSSSSTSGVSVASAGGNASSNSSNGGSGGNAGSGNAAGGTGSGGGSGAGGTVVAGNGGGNGNGNNGNGYGNGGGNENGNNGNHGNGNNGNHYGNGNGNGNGNGRSR